MKIVADLHTHSVASAHAYSTILENCRAAKERGLIAMATTDHGPKITDGAHPYFFRGLANILPRHVGGVCLIIGIEANILNERGEVDIYPEWSHVFDFGIASIHEDCFGKSDFDRTTSAYLNVLDNPNIDLIGHSGTLEYTYDFDKVIRKCAELGKMIEINAATFRYRQSSLKNCAEIARTCAKYGVGVMVNSDSHICETVGVVENAIKMLEEIGFPEELVINGDADRLNKYFMDKKGLNILE